MKSSIFNKKSLKKLRRNAISGESGSSLKGDESSKSKKGPAGEKGVDTS